MQKALEIQKQLQEEAVAKAEDDDAPIKLAALETEIAEGEYRASQEVPVELSNAEKTKYDNAARTHRERNFTVEKHGGKAISLVTGQCTQLLIEHIKLGTEWEKVGNKYDTLLRYKLIEITAMAKIEDQYPFATVYEQETSFNRFRQETLTNGSSTRRSKLEGQLA